MKKKLLLPLIFSTVFSLCGCSLVQENKENSNKDNNAEYEFNKKAAVSFSFDDATNSRTEENVSHEKYRIKYVFSEDNADILFKKPNDPLLKQGVNNKSLYMDGFSTSITISDYEAPVNKITFSTWVAPRGFENLDKYGNETIAAGHPRMTSLFDYGIMENGEGFLFGYGRLGLWGLQLNLYNTETGQYLFAGYYDPINSLPLYEWSHIAATFDGETGYIKAKN